MKKFFIFTCSILLLGTSFLCAQTTSIPDANFEDYLETHTPDGVLVSVGDALSMGDGIANNALVTTANIATVTSLNVSNLNIQDLTGIQDFNDLTTLICSNNSLTSLNISNNNGLTTLLCGINQLTNLDVSNNNALEVLNCSSNQLANLDVSNNLNLERLSCSNNRISSIDIGLNTALFFLSVSENQLTSLDVTSNTKIEQLFCASNLITNLNLSNNTVLSTLNASQNAITNLDLSTINTISCPNPQTEPTTPCQSSATIDVSYNQLMSLNIANANNDLITAFNSEQNPDLFCIQTDSGFIVPNNNWVKDDWTYYGDTGCTDIFTYVPDDNFEQRLITLGLDDVLDHLVLTSNINTITSLDVSNLNIDSLVGIEDFIALQTLDCSGNNIDALNLSNNMALLNLNASDNNLASLNLESNTNLAILNISQNALTVLDVSNTLLLTTLDCSNNSIKLLDISLLTAITDLSCTTNSLEVLNIKNGQNASLLSFNATANPDLSCIETDTGIVPAGVTWTVDATATYAVTCGTYVPDDGFEQALIDAGFDTAPLDNYVPTANIIAQTNLNVSAYNITDLTGIEDFAALTVFDCSNNAIEILNLTANTALTSITCNDNALEFADIRNGNNTNATVFNATNNPNLFCINVDAGVIGSIPGGWVIDPIANYNSDCENNRYTPIPDNNFEQALIDLGIDSGAIDGQVLTANIEYLTTLDINGRNIESLEGIKAFLSLTELDCSNNYLNALDVSNMTNLEALYCSSNYFLTSNPTNINGVLNITGTANLKTLYCSGNLLSDLDVSSKLNLEDLNCSDNKITNLNVNNNVLLQQLNCSNNQLTGIDISNLTVLETINCSVNSISNLITSAVNNSTLTHLNCSNNDLSTLQINTYLSLEDLSCNSNSISNLNTDNNTLLVSLNCSNNLIDGLNLTQNTALATLYASQNNITQLDLVSNVALEYLDCNYNAITTIDIGATTSLKYVYANNNNLNSLDVSNNTGLIVLDASFNDITSMVLPNNLNQLKTFNCSNNLLENDLDLSSLGISACPSGEDLCPGFITINVSNNQLDFVNIQNGMNNEISGFNASANPKLYCIQVDDINNIGANWTKDVTTSYSIDCRFGETYVPDDNFEQALINLGYDTGPLDDYVLTANIEVLTALNVSGNNISDVTGIEDFVALQDLDCSNNTLSTIDLSNNVSLTIVNCSNNVLSVLDLAENTNLTNLNVANNAFTMFDVSLVPLLETFNCDTNQITELDFSTNTALISLSCQSNLLEVLNIQNGQNTNLSNLNAQSNTDLTCILTDTGAVPPGVTWLKDVVAIYAIDCHYGETYVPDDAFETALIDLGYDTVLDDYVLTSTIESLSFLDVGEKSITDLTGIEDFISLRTLFVDNNMLADIDLSNNTLLENFNGSSNNLSQIDLLSNPSLVVLNISNNTIAQVNFDNNLNLLNINVSNNQLTILEVNLLVDLSVLDCSNNLIANLNIVSNPNVEELYCQSNLLVNDQLNLKNGSNATLRTLVATNNPDLGCILVDDPVAVISNVSGDYDNWFKDATANYQSVCDDADNDGVANADDNCPGTPFGASVDLFGCPILDLPNDNFTILITSETCLNNNDGKINITTKEFYNYTATLTGEDFNRVYNFTKEIDIKNLLAGTYTLCITAEEFPGYTSCFDVVITQPEPLEVSTGKSSDGKKVSLYLSGSSNYTIEFNGLNFKTNKDVLELVLQHGENIIKVSTDIECQGVFEEHIFISDEVLVFPNPFKNTIKINTGANDSDTVNVCIYSISGHLVFSKTFTNNKFNNLNVNSNELKSGLYVLTVKSEAKTSTFKMIKQ